MSHQDIDRVLDQAQHDQTPKGLRDFAILTLLALYGLRAGEIVALRLELAPSTGLANRCS
jgi:integrase